jgi:MYXO-CTERM domain-containing protein
LGCYLLCLAERRATEFGIRRLILEGLARIVVVHSRVSADKRALVFSIYWRKGIKSMKVISKFAMAASLAALISTAANADVFGPGAGGALPDATISNSIAGSGVFTSTIVVGAVGNIISFNSVTLTNLQHTFAGDIQAYLDSPNGTRVNLISRLGVVGATGAGNGNNFTGNYTFVDSGGLTFSTTGVVPPGTYNRYVNQGATVVQVGATGTTQGINNNAFSAFVGESVTGIWTLTIRDYFPADIGSLGSWSFDATIPAPGALALLGLAGLAGGRRRRA